MMQKMLQTDGTARAKAQRQVTIGQKELKDIWSSRMVDKVWKGLCGRGQALCRA